MQTVRTKWFYIDTCNIAPLKAGLLNLLTAFNLWSLSIFKNLHFQSFPASPRPFSLRQNANRRRSSNALLARRPRRHRDDLDGSRRRETLRASCHNGENPLKISQKLLNIWLPQADMLNSLSRTKPTVNDEDMKKLQKFTDDFGQEG